MATSSQKLAVEKAAGQQSRRAGKQSPTMAPPPSPALSPDLSETQSFRATLEPDNTSLKWIIAWIPFDPHAVWPTMLRLRVTGTLNDVPFRTSLFPSRHLARSGYFLLVNKRLQKESCVSSGQSGDFTLAPDLAPRPPVIHPTLLQALRPNRKLLRWTQSLPEHTLREISKWVEEPATPEACAHRAEQIAERLLHAMEGEHTPPPILEAVFTRQPEARRGWAALTPNQRRGHLLAIFYYSSPEARQRRAEKAIADALRAARKRAPLLNPRQ